MQNYDYATQIQSLIDSGKNAISGLEEEKSENERQKVDGKFFRATLSTIRKIPKEAIVDEIDALDADTFQDLLEP